MSSPYRTRPRERGVIAIVFALVLLALLAMAGFVLDLGHIYIGKAQLQNATDGAALAGALDLDGSATGVANALDMARKVARKNRYNFTADLILDDTDITFGKKPDGPWVDAGAASVAPTTYTFIKIDTGPKVIDTYLMRAVGIDTARIAALAVAGHFLAPADPGIRLHR